MDTVSIHLLFDVGNEVVPGIDYRRRLATVPASGSTPITLLKLKYGCVPY
jgi:hypothetical protein